jgi:1-phosphofructokinase
MIVTVTPNPAIDVTLEVDDFRPGGVCRARSLGEQAAGKGINVALCLNTLGVESRAVALTGESDAALYLVAFRGTRAAAKLVSGAFRTRRNITIVDRAGGADTHLREAGPSIAAADAARFERAIEESAAAGDVVAFCGSLPPGFSAERFGEVVARCARGGRRVALDAEGAPLRAAARHAYMIKPNLAELGTLAGRDAAWAGRLAAAGEEELAREVEAACAACGTPCVCVTCGARGAFLFTEGRRLRALLEGSLEGFRNSRGAGDCFLAAYLARSAQGLAPAECLREAVACSAASCLTPGTAAFDPAVARELLSRVRVRQRA